MKTRMDYQKEVEHVEELIERNLTRLSKTVSRIQNLRKKEGYLWMKIADFSEEKKP